MSRPLNFRSPWLFLFPLAATLLSANTAQAFIGEHFSASGLSNEGSVLSHGQTLNSSEALVSPNGLFYINTQSDGNFCARYTEDGSGIWCSRSTAAFGQNFVTTMQVDGNVCTTYGVGGAGLWCIADKARNDGPFYLTIQDDANVCVYRASTGSGDNSAVWCSMAIVPNAQPPGETLVYGASYHLQNGYQNWSGGFLDTRGAGCSDNALCVSTANSADRHNRSGTWLILSATGKAVGEPVLPGDRIYLANRYPRDFSGDSNLVPESFGGYLDTRGRGCADNYLCVSTSWNHDRDWGSGTWIINANTKRLREGQSFTLLNGYDNNNGGYLDTRGRGCSDNLLCVSTSGSPDRDSGSGSWRMSLSIPARPAHPLNDVELAQRFAPRLRFDGSAHGYPMSADEFYTTVVKNGGAVIQNTDSGTLLSGNIPIYYQVVRCGNQARIKYWFFYGYQQSCDQFNNGSHNGDWEDITVVVSEDQSRVASVSYSMHGLQYTRLTARGGVAIEETTHPVIYVGKNTHANFFNQGGSGAADNCIPWEEYRNNTYGARLDSWKKLVDLNGNSESWIQADRTIDFNWGPDGVSNHPTRKAPTCDMDAASWDLNTPTFSHSQCQVGDDDSGTGCVKQCRSGYTQYPLTCTNWDITSLHTYSRELYKYNYSVPTSDVGLLAPNNH